MLLDRPPTLTFRPQNAKTGSPYVEYQAQNCKVLSWKFSFGAKSLDDRPPNPNHLPQNCNLRAKHAIDPLQNSNPQAQKGNCHVYEFVGAEFSNLSSDPSLLKVTFRVKFDSLSFDITNHQL